MKNDHFSLRKPPTFTEFHLVTPRKVNRTTRRKITTVETREIVQNLTTYKSDSFYMRLQSKLSSLSKAS